MGYGFWRSRSKVHLGIGGKLTALILLVYLTNNGVVDRLRFVIDDARPLTAIVFVAIWMICLGALAAAAFHPRPLVRFLWAIPIALSSAIAYGYHRAQGGEFFIFDVLNLWAARHEAGRAADFYGEAIPAAIAVLLIGLIAIIMPPALPRRLPRISHTAMLVAPLVPILMIAGVVVMKEGKGSYSLPRQFAPISLAALAAYKINTGGFEERHAVALPHGTPLVRAIVLIVDESIRADHVSLSPGNRSTPAFAEHAERWVDFGPAVAAGNCSRLSNAILRLMADRHDVVRSIHTSPTVWDYAKAAGYRTVFIDAQAKFVNVHGKLQNLMTPAETLKIDRMHQLGSDIATHDLDDALTTIVLEELAADGPVFIYANKNGAHFPYDNGSPEAFIPSGVFLPTDSDATHDMFENYLRAVQWSTDRPMARLSAEAELDDAVVIYTSDHGQHFEPGRLTHCSSDTNVDVNEAIVPLMAATDNMEIAARLRDTAAHGAGRGTHFAIAPTILELMGYRPSDFASRYDVSLLDDLSWAPSFVSGDILGLFSPKPDWHPADPTVQQPQTGDAIAELTGQSVVTD
ncbi:sulfatase-like hydrolase/transferase [Pararhizobium haloflavum]|uniref:sulfatase-like hydrolase/transferase n=1 Tax=Pararhizobium haloflavum TaxID=2037914 RepID=UPI0012FFD6FE|nr:sulfatase-like hydrolase/transferase [Pararhizobium haloflavum]